MRCVETDTSPIKYYFTCGEANRLMDARSPAPGLWLQRENASYQASDSLDSLDELVDISRRIYILVALSIQLLHIGAAESM